MAVSRTAICLPLSCCAPCQYKFLQFLFRFLMAIQGLKSERIEYKRGSNFHTVSMQFLISVTQVYMHLLSTKSVVSASRRILHHVNPFIIILFLCKFTPCVKFTSSQTRYKLTFPYDPWWHSINYTVHISILLTSTEYLLLGQYV